MTEPQVLVERTSIIKLEGDVSQVFSLFGPLEERKWAEGWNPRVVWPVDETVQERMVFVVHHGDDPETMWIVSKYDAQQATIEYTVYKSESVRWILIRCRASEDGASTEAEITYTYVGASETARHRNAHALEAMYRHDLKDWERLINHYLRTGERLSHH